jgi:hypothetical protein
VREAISKFEIVFFLSWKSMKSLFYIYFKDKVKCIKKMLKKMDKAWTEFINCCKIYFVNVIIIKCRKLR